MVDDSINNNEQDDASHKIIISEAHYLPVNNNDFELSSYEKIIPLLDEENLDENKEIFSHDNISQSLPAKVVRDSNPEKIAKIKDLFPGRRDGGLTYAMMLALTAIDDSDDVEEGSKNLLYYYGYFEFESIMRVYKNRRDLPTPIRNYLRNYLVYLGFEESAVKQNHTIIQNHYVKANHTRYFLTKLYQEELLEEFIKHIRYDYIDLKNNIPITEFINYSEEDHDAISWLNFDHIERSLEEDNYDNDVYKAFLKKLLDPAVYLKHKLQKPSEIIWSQLEIQFPNFSEVTAYYKAQFRLNQMTGKERIPPILLLGEPGIGKTHFAKCLAKALQTGYTFIDLASATDAWVLSGLHAGWKNGKPGKLFSAMLNSPTLSPVVLMDEIEKSPKGHHDATTPLYQLLEETNAKEFVDEFVDLPADLSHIIVIACANSLEGLSEPLQSRFRIFNVPSPSPEQHATIINHIYQEEKNHSNLFEDNLSLDIIYLLSNYSIREAKVKLTEAIGKALLEFNEDELAQIKLEQYKIKLEPHHIVDVKTHKKKFGFS